MTKRPETPSAKANPNTVAMGKAPKSRAAAPGSILPNRDIAAQSQPGAEPTQTASPAQPVDSTLVGQGGGLPAMPQRREKPLRLGQRLDIAGEDRESGQKDNAAKNGGGKGPAPASAQAADKAVPTATTAADTATGGKAIRDSLPSDTGPAQQPTADKAPTASYPGSASPGPSASTPSASPPPAVRPAPAAPRRGGFAPLFLGGVVAAALGAGATWWAIPRLPDAWRPAGTPVTDSAALTEAATAAARAEIDSRAAAIETRAVQAATQAAAADAASHGAGPERAAERDTLITEARQAGADAAAKLIAEAPASPQPDGGVETTLAAQARQLAALDQRVTELAQAAPAAATPAVDLAPLQQQIDALAQRPSIEPATVERLNALAAEAEAVTARITAAADAAEARLRETETRASELGAAATDAARVARATAAAAALGEAIETGAPRDAALAQLQGAGIEPAAALTAEIPTLETLAADFPAAARAALRADLRTGAAEGSGSLIGNFLRAQTGARSVTPREGVDTDAVLSRAGDALTRGAVGQALSELEALPEPARPAMQGWIARARAYADAQTALDRLTVPPATNPTGASNSAPQPAQPAAPGTTPPVQSDAAQPGAGAAPAATPSN